MGRLITLVKWVLQRLEGAAPTKATADTPGKTEYPWFGIVEGEDLEQGDILESCPVFQPPRDLDVQTKRNTNVIFDWKEQDLIVMTQTCDLVLADGRPAVEDVLLCAVWKRSEFTGGHFLAKDSEMENARKGRLPAVHVLSESKVAGFVREVRVVDFKRVYSLPTGFVRRRAGMAKRLRLLPPYREHLSQSFARYFMRVGLPIDIPRFTKKK